MYQKIVFFLLISIAAFGQNPNLTAFYEGPFADIQAEAKRSKKPVFLDFTSSSCAHCVSMQKQVFSVKNIADRLNTGFLAYKVDVSEPVGKQLATKFNVFDFPTFLVIDRNGVLMGEIMGFHTARQFLNELNKITDTSPEPTIAAPKTSKKKRFFGLFN
jgi:thioredoxin 1